MTNDLSPERIDDYLSNVRKGRTQCLFCGSSDIEGTGQRDYDADWYANRIRCLDCGAEWNDMYKIVSVEVVKPGKLQ